MSGPNSGSSDLCVWVFQFVCLYLCVCICVFVFVRLYLCVCICVFVFVRIFVFVHLSTERVSRRATGSSGSKLGRRKSDIKVK